MHSRDRSGETPVHPHHISCCSALSHTVQYCTVQYSPFSFKKRRRPVPAGWPPAPCARSGAPAAGHTPRPPAPLCCAHPAVSCAFCWPYPSISWALCCPNPRASEVSRARSPPRPSHGLPPQKEVRYRGSGRQQHKFQLVTSTLLEHPKPSYESAQKFSTVQLSTSDDRAMVSSESSLCPAGRRGVGRGVVCWWCTHQWRSQRTRAVRGGAP